MNASRLVQRQAFSDEGLEGIAQTFRDLGSIVILQAVSTTPRTAQELSENTGIPLSSMYRKLAALKKVGLVYLKSSEISGGRKRDFFSSAVNEIRVVIDTEGIVLDLVPTEGYAERAQSGVIGGSGPRFSGSWSLAVKDTTPSD